MQKMVDLTVLIDDSEIDLFIHRRFLELCHFSREVISHRSAETALKWLQDLNGTPPPNVIFLDLNMPVLDGFGFLDLFSGLPERLKSLTKIVVLTSSNSVTDRQQVLSHHNVISMITKPIKQSDIDSLRLQVTA